MSKRFEIFDSGDGKIGFIMDMKRPAGVGKLKFDSDDVGDDNKPYYKKLVKVLNDNADKIPHT